MLIAFVLLSAGLYYTAIETSRAAAARNHSTKRRPGRPLLSAPTTAPPVGDSWWSWLAGLIDGDGCLLVSSAGYVFLEITMGLADLHVLLGIQAFLGGSVKRRNSASYRYRLTSTAAMLVLVQGINGLVLHTGRYQQLCKVCSVLDIMPVPSVPLSVPVPYQAGLFDADGTIGMWPLVGSSPLLSIRVAAKFSDIFASFDCLGGGLYFDSSGYGCWVWSVQSRSDVLSVAQTLSLHSVSHKGRRFALVPEYFELRDIRAYMPHNPQHGALLNFIAR